MRLSKLCVGITVKVDGALVEASNRPSFKALDHLYRFLRRLAQPPNDQSARGTSLMRMLYFSHF
jgi:hypothetical protein